MPKPPRKKAVQTETESTSAEKAPARRRRSPAAKRTKRAQSPRTVAQVVAHALDDLKAFETTFLDVRHLTTVTDAMAIASGRSDRHVRAIANAVVEQSKQAGFRPIGVEGANGGEWVLVDLGELVVHVMLPRVREFYNLEKLWDIAARDDAAAAEAGA
ncbi:MAG: ribosome silencing factor [Gammaproteobacteria bacterium]